MEAKGVKRQMPLMTVSTQVPRRLEKLLRRDAVERNMSRQRLVLDILEHHYGLVVGADGVYEDVPVAMVQPVPEGRL